MRLLMFFILLAVTFVVAVYVQSTTGRIGGMSTKLSSAEWVVEEPGTLFVGIVPDEQRLIRSVTVTTSGDRVIDVESVTSSCGCVRIETGPSVIMPSSNSRIDLEVNPLSCGPFRQTVRINSAQESSLYGLDIVGVKAGVWSDQKAITLGNVHSNTTGQATFRVFGITKSAVSPRQPQVHSEDSRLAVGIVADHADVTRRLLSECLDTKQFEQAELSGWKILSWTVAVEWSGGAGTSGWQTGLVNVTYESTNLTVPIHYKHEPVAVVPRLLHFGTVASVGQYERTCSVTIPEESISIDSIVVVSQHSLVTAEFRKSSERRGEVICRLSVNKPTDSHLLQGDIVVRSEGKDIATIPFIAVVAKDEK